MEERLKTVSGKSGGDFEMIALCLNEVWRHLDIEFVTFSDSSAVLS